MIQGPCPQNQDLMINGNMIGLVNKIFEMDTKLCVDKEERKNDSKIGSSTALKK